MLPFRIIGLLAARPIRRPLPRHARANAVQRIRWAIISHRGASAMARVVLSTRSCRATDAAATRDILRCFTTARPKTTEAVCTPTFGYATAMSTSSVANCSSFCHPDDISTSKAHRELGRLSDTILGANVSSVKFGAISTDSSAKVVMNWRKSLFRLWLAISLLWIAVTAWVTYRTVIVLRNF